MTDLSPNSHDAVSPTGRPYRVVHRTEYGYGATMIDGYSVAYLLTRPTPSQRVLSSMLTTTPTSDEFDEWSDVFGNRMVQLGVHQPHDTFTVEAVSEVVVYSQETPRTNQPWERVAAQVSSLRGPLVLETSAFMASSRYIPIDEHRRALVALASVAFTPRRPVLDAVEALCRLIFETFAFDPTFTEVSTPLGDVLDAQRGVCQDFAHLAVGCLRSIGLASRYVSGYIETEPPAGEVKSIGADASHAWCSVWIPDHGWLDFDPTNGVVAPGRHITVAWGRDYADVAPLRGVVIGPNAPQSLSVSVDVRRL
jgi:transglutaminase-like putative cysteine protease